MIEATANLLLAIGTGFGLLTILACMVGLCMRDKGDDFHDRLWMIVVTLGTSSTGVLGLGLVLHYLLSK
jgi:hypothetical protein